MKISVCCLILLSLLVESSFQLRAIFKQNPNAYQSGNLPSQNYIQQNANQPNQYVQPANSANSVNQSNPYQPNSGYQQISGYQQAAPQQQPSQSQQTGYQQPAQSQPAQQKPAQQQQPSQSYQANYQQPAQQPNSQAQIQPCQASSGSAQPASSQSSYGQAQSANSAQSSQSGYKIDPQPNLYCYSCNENSASCSSHYISADFLTPCNGQCIKFRNPNDKFKWYRGCSWDKGFNEEEPSVVYKDNTLYYFCNSSGCNA